MYFEIGCAKSDNIRSMNHRESINTYCTLDPLKLLHRTYMYVHVPVLVLQLKATAVNIQIWQKCVCV